MHRTLLAKIPLLKNVLVVYLSVTGFALAAPEIAVTGKGFTILDGDSTPRVEDNSDFGIASANSQQVKRVFWISNTGSSDLDISDIMVDAPQFTITANPQSVIPADGVSSFEISYQPLTAGTHNATVTINNNDADENPYTFAIRGIAKAPEIQLQGLAGLNINNADTSPTTDDGTDFGTRTLKQAVEREFTIENTGEVNLQILSVGISPGPFSISEQPANSIAPGSSTKFKVRYFATEAGGRSATVTILNNDLDEGTFTFLVKATANEPEISVFGNAIAINAGDLSPDLDDGTKFSTISYKASVPSKTFLVRNTGTGTLLIESVTLSDTTNFQITSALPASIAPNASANLVVEYNPVSAGNHNASISITTNDLDESPYNFAISASSIVPNSNFGALTNGDTTPSVGEGTDFGSGIVGAPAILRQYPISNAGPGTLIIKSINISPNNNFALQSGLTFPLSVAPGTVFQLPIGYAPTGLGQHVATVTIETNDPANYPFVFDVSGVGNTRTALVGNPLAPIMNGDATPSTTEGTDLGTADIGVVPPNRITIPVKNTGTVPLTLSSVLLGDNTNFTIEGNPLGAIAPGATQNIVVAFTPQSPGLKTTSVTINSNDPTSPFVFAVQGFSRPVVQFGSTLVAAPAVTRTQAMTNNGTEPVTVTSITISPNEQFHYTGTAVPFVINPAETINLPLSYLPTAVGNHSAVVTVRTSGDNPAYPFSFKLNGSSDKRLVVVGSGSTLLESGDTTPNSLDGTDFGRVIVGVGATVTRVWPVSNEGNVPLQITSVTLSNATDFVITNSPAGMIAPGASSNLTISFMPQTAADLTSIVTIHSNDPRSPFTFHINGDGGARVEIQNPEIQDPTLTTQPWNSNFSGPYAAIIATPDENGRPVTPYGGGFDSFVVKSDGSFTASGTFLDQPLKLKGKIGPDGRYVGFTTLPDGSIAAIDIQTKTGADGTTRIVGTLKHAGKTWVIEAIRALTGNIPTNMIGKYTFAIPGAQGSPEGVPSGDGVGDCVLRIDGRMTVKCRLADTNVFTMTSYITPRYQWMISKLVQRNDGRLSGIVRFRDIPKVSDFDGLLYWNKTPRQDHQHFKQGFSITRNMVGNYYVQPKNKPAIADMLVTGENNALFQIGSAAQGVPVSPKMINWLPNNKIMYQGPDSVALKFIPKTGRITGTYKDYVSGSSVSIDGVVLQKQHRAVGLIYNNNITGYFSILPRQYTGY